MKFGVFPVDDALGAVLAHAVKQGDVVLKKGTVIGAQEVARLKQADVASIVAARLEAGDVDEDAAALRLAGAVAGAGVRVEAPFTGRANLFADSAGVLMVDAQVIDRTNLVDEAITIATLPPLKAVVAGEMIGTVKIIPFAVPETLLQRALPGRAAIRVAPFGQKRVAVVSTLLPGLKPSVVAKTVGVLRQRLEPAAATLATERKVEHDAAALAAVLAEPEVRAADIVVVFGASAITDRADVIPAAIEMAGGRVEHFGMPVDPGNLLLIGEISGRPVIGAPGCARSPRENGFDWVLARFLADIPVTRADIQRMGVGGLLMEIVSRPQPREADAPAHVRPGASPGPVEIIILAAGRSTRMAGRNKLLTGYRGKPLVRHVAEHALASGVGPVTVVLGHQGASVRSALAGLDLRFADNPSFAEGMSTSLKAGVAALGPDAGAAIVLLGDMPLVGPGLIRRLAAVYREAPDVKAVVPTFLGQKGNPVLIARPLFKAVAAVSGDIGARKIIEAAADGVMEVAVDDAGALCDIDTPEALTSLESGAPGSEA